MPIKDPQLRKQKQREYSRKHYQTNRAKCIARSKQYKRSARQKFLEFKSRLACVKCGQNHPATLDFHHVEPHPSNKKINHLTCKGAYEAAIKEIIEKCIVLCANCHRIHHFDERNKSPEHDQLTVDTD